MIVLGLVPGLVLLTTGVVNVVPTAIFAATTLGVLATAIH